VVSGEPKLVGSAINAVRQYQFAPCIQDGRPVESQTTITVSYDLRREAFYPEDASSNLPKEPQEDVIHEIERGELFQLRDGVTFPKALHVVNPKYSDAARKSKFEGYVSLGVVVGTDGKPRSVWLVDRRLPVAHLGHLHTRLVQIEFHRVGIQATSAYVYLNHA